MIGILAGTLIGVVLGTISGLVPGIHVNTFAGVLLGFQFVLIPVLGPEILAAIMIAALVTHTFLDSVPSTFLGIPDPDTALSVLPAHALCMEGHGEEAVRISALGSALGAAVAVPFAVALSLVFPPLQGVIDWWVGILIIAVAGYLIVSGESPGWNLALFLVCGILGTFTLHFTYLGSGVCGVSSLLMPLLAGLFGIPLLLGAASGPMPLQRYSGIRMGGKEIGKGAVLGTVAGAAVGWLPGLSNATANAVLASAVTYDRERRGFILATGAANTANAFLGIAAFYAIGRTRNGVMVALSMIEAPVFGALLAAGTVAACLAYIITVRCAGGAGFMAGIERKKLNLLVIAFVVAASVILTGPFGAFVLVLATLAGLIPCLVNIPRVFCMGAIMVPVVLYSFQVVL